ncbi:putative spermidine/putrescine transport system substrate-binding protein [Collimonas sp. OK307]|uniref:ABC transporter substrate-binding protein n=1 Tax=Collimonas sp. OK307 TaxID=1801620 RepID=UPI0008E18B55|nr:ABC transporter substrate-binding protein [Collimonas sp. OK307]SFI02204.1 putative spermidine/putrescine transport system substrate-binding protein [Collimonas sp. OK307]
MKFKHIILATGFISALGVAAASHAETRTLYVGMNGGSMEKNYTSYIFPEFEKANNVKIVVVPGTSADIMAKMSAQKDKPQMHLVFLDDGVMYRAIGMGLCQKLKDAPVFKEIYPFARMANDQAVGIELGTVGIGYNKKMFDEKGWAAPTSWMDFADPKYKGKVVFQSIQSSTFGLHSFLMFNRLVGGTDKNVEPGFQKWGSTVGPNVLEYLSSSAKISEMVQTGETAIFPLTPTAIANLKAKGIPAEFATPKEGAVMLMVGACALKNNSEPDLSQKLAEYLLSAGSQAKAMEYANAIPINKNVKIPESVQAKIGNIDKLMKNINTVDWDVINKERAAWNDRWSRMIER